jgi:hypothetical protein
VLVRAPAHVHARPGDAVHVRVLPGAVRVVG